MWREYDTDHSGFIEADELKVKTAVLLLELCVCLFFVCFVCFFVVVFFMSFLRNICIILMLQFPLL